ncbi:PREDICTED: uncharacterized protein LOC109338217 [Lupinus angustifolius]|uniref:uncharacterized protein LOC109338217 n=1 Tax=Lupinus angustifolius TaxID=3871 RepID=UPI00092EB8EF|nr:PREDICTED: uncharacterized protein LOC109338217 [Lupinus angustifolius]XP_019430948.1 PREDICTED: uncharacterized protein LOC109338217 [Lupinus angustifolius]
MEYAEDGDAPLNFASFQIFPNQNRYETFVCKGKQSEKIAAGQLEHLLPHVPAINDLYAKGCDANFDLQLSENLHGAEWFSKVTVKRFLHVVTLPNLVNDINTIMDEMYQLEDSKKFHVSLYGKPEVNNVSSETSKNDLLRAMDLRLTALRNKLAETLSEATGATCSTKDIAYLAKFSQHFGATNIENSLSKFIELNQKSQDVGPMNNETTCDMSNDGSNRSVKNLPISKPVHSDTPVKYSVSPAKAAQVERHSPTESESSNSGDEDQASAERSRSLIRSTTPRRSASPMRRVQIGRTGTRKAATLTIKSLSYFPSRERLISYKDAAEDDSNGEISEQPHKKTEIDVRRITVQDAISLFESKQRDETAGTQKRKSLTEVSISTTKSVLRRWSTNSGMGETSVRGHPELVHDDPVPVSSNDVAYAEILKNSKVGVVSNFISESHNNNENTVCDVKPEMQESVGSNSVENQEETGPKVREDIVDKLAVSEEWNKRKQAEFNQILKKMVESKPVLFGKSQPNRKQNVTFEQRGGSYDHYKEKRDAKLSREKPGKQVEKEAQYQEMQQLLDKKKAEMLSKSSTANKKSSARLPQKSLRNSTQPANSPGETAKPSVTKKTSSKTSPMPAIRKSWSATPSPRASAISPAKARSGISSASTTPTRQKPMSTAAVPQPSSQREKSQQRSRNEKETQTGNVGSFKSTNEKRQPAVPAKSKAIKAKTMTSSGETSVTSKIGLGNKGTKKSSVVPLESKPLLHKGTRPGPGNHKKKKSPPKLDKPLRDSEDLINDQESELVVNASDLVSQHSDRDQNNATEIESQINNHMQCDETKNVDQNRSENGDVSTNIEEFSLKIENEEESTISPSAWVDTEEDLKLPKPCEDITFQPAFQSNFPAAGSTSPRVRHSLSQMLQEETSEPETSEWGNAENPPVMIYQKDAPKGLKRLLKFARKSKGDAGSSGWSSPSIFSEGEDDAEEFKNSNKRNADNLLRKAALNAKSYGHPKCSVREVYERNLASRDDGKGSQKMQEGRDSSTGPTTRGSRSFFSLSAFRGNKPSESRFH